MPHAAARLAFPGNGPGKSVHGKRVGGKWGRSFTRSGNRVDRFEKGNLGKSVSQV